MPEEHLKSRGMIQVNSLFLTFVTVFLLRSGTQFFLNRLNIFHLRQQGKTVPRAIGDAVDQEKLSRIRDYTRDSAHFGMVAALSNQVLFLVILLSGFLPWLVGVIDSCNFGPIIDGLVFFALLSMASNLLHIPFSLYDAFVIESRYGFNVMTFRMWVVDFLKGTAVFAILGGFLLWLLLAIVIHGGTPWWVWAWMLMGGFELLALWLFPVVIAPLFNKFEPIEDQGLEERIRALMKEVGLRIQAVLKMDASKRSKHTNAYFTGLGTSKRIVLFDTLLASHSQEEILAVLAHEAGHWKRRHVFKQVVLAEALSFAGFYWVARCLEWPLLYQTFGFTEPISYIGLFLVGALAGPFIYFAQPAGSALSRRFEREADDFALELVKTPDPMCSALRRLAADNLANLSPHPLYAWFYYSHPPLVERIEGLKEKGDRLLFAS